MSADLMDPWDLPADTHQPLTSDEFEAIKADIFESPWTDPARFPECLTIAVESLRDIACGVGNPYTPTVAATQALRRMVQRSVSGVPFNEPQEPAWSLDAERERPFERVLDEAERHD